MVILHELESYVIKGKEGEIPGRVRAWERSRLSTAADDPRDSQGKSVFWFFNMEHWGCLIPSRLRSLFGGYYSYLLRKTGTKGVIGLGEKAKLFPFSLFLSHYSPLALLACLGLRKACGAGRHLSAFLCWLPWILCWAYLRREICVSKSVGLALQILCFTLYLRVISKYKPPEGLIFGGAI